MPSVIAPKTTAPENGNRDLRMDLETRLTKDDHQSLRLWLRLLSCSIRIENQVRARLRQDFETTLPRFDLMAQLERSPNGLRMNDLSKRLMVSKGNVTGITDQLEKEGLVMRIPDRYDRRVITVMLTELGFTSFRQMADQHEEWILRMFEGLNREEKQTMFALLKKLKSHLELSEMSCASASDLRRR